MSTKNNISHVERANGWFALLLVACTLLIGSLTFGAGKWVAAERSYDLRGPVTGAEFADFLEDREHHLRPVLTDYDGLLVMSREASDRPMIDVLRERHREADVTAEPETAATAITE